MAESVIEGRYLFNEKY